MDRRSQFLSPSLSQRDRLAERFFVIREPRGFPCEIISSLRSCGAPPRGNSLSNAYAWWMNKATHMSFVGYGSRCLTPPETGTRCSISSPTSPARSRLDRWLNCIKTAGNWRRRSSIWRRTFIPKSIREGTPRRPCLACVWPWWPTTSWRWSWPPDAAFMAKTEGITRCLCITSPMNSPRRTRA